MRIIAAIYLTIMLVNFGIWLVSGSGGFVVASPHSYLIWILYCFSVVALLAYILHRRFLPRRVWQAVFVVYVATRLFELAVADRILAGEDFTANLNVIASYLWLVVPAGLAMGYLGFARRATLRETETFALHPMDVTGMKNPGHGWPLR
jgi:hypothetical protein